MNAEICHSDRKKKVQVCVRIRPMSAAETELHPIPIWKWENNTILLNDEANSGRGDEANGDSAVRASKYTYDHLFHPEHTTRQIYSEVVEDIVCSTMEGYHGTVFAYGQTSTGKTYTMQGTEANPGVIPLAVDAVFDYISNFNDREFLLRVSYLEIYNEQVVDLLSPKNTTGIQILNNKAGKVMIRGLKEEVVVNPDQVYSLITSGEAYRHTAETAFNRESSRSHTIFRLVVESRLKQEMPGTGRTSKRSLSSGSETSLGTPPFLTPDNSPRSAGSVPTNAPKNPVKVSILNLVDLAGSEGGKANTATGARRKEGHFINKSLHTLSHVIFKLSEIADLEAAAGRGENPKKQPGRIHIPYRDSKLTRLLQASLSGNAQVAVICTVTPARRSVDETHNTLKFASRAKRVRSSAVVNEVLDDKALLKKYREEIVKLQGQLAIARKQHEEVALVARRYSHGSNVSEISSGAEDSPSLESKGRRSFSGTEKLSVEGNNSPSPPRATLAISTSRVKPSSRRRLERQEASEEVSDLINAIHHLERLILAGGKRHTPHGNGQISPDFALPKDVSTSPRFFENKQHSRLRSRSQQIQGFNTPTSGSGSITGTPKSHGSPISDISPSSRMTKRISEQYPFPCADPTDKDSRQSALPKAPGSPNNNDAIDSQQGKDGFMTISPSLAKDSHITEFDIKSELETVKQMLHRVLLRKNPLASPAMQKSTFGNGIAAKYPSMRPPALPTRPDENPKQEQQEPSPNTKEELQQNSASNPELDLSLNLQEPLSPPLLKSWQSTPPPNTQDTGGLGFTEEGRELEAQKLGAALSQADSQFLEIELQKKQQLVNEMMGLLTDVEKRQTALEEENQQLRRRVQHLSSVVTAREDELMQLKGISQEEETF